MSLFPRKYYLLPVLILLAVWCGWFIHQSSFEINGETWYSLFDDSMITMTYAKNLTQGHGLNWAKFGEPVEGFSSPLWMFVMVPFQLLPIAWGKVSLAFMIFCTGLLMVNVMLLDRLLDRGFGIRSVPVRLVACFSMAFLYPMNYWTLEGMEPGAQVFLFLLGLDLFIAFEQHRQERTLHRLGIVLALALLLRMDMVFFVGWTLLFLSPWLLKNRRIAFKFLAITALPMAGYLIFRLIYFHDIFPNTYYLKLSGIPLDIRWERAWFHFSKWAEPLWLIWLALPLMLIPRFRERKIWLTFLLALTYLAYNLHVGGDAWEESGIGANRFTVIVLPFLLVILAAGGYAWGKRISGLGGKVIGHVAPIAGCLLLFVLINGILFMPGQKKKLDQLLVMVQPYNTLYHKWNTMDGIGMNEWLGTGNRVATVQAGGVGYFANCELIDLLGYNDRTIAKQPPYWDLRSTPINMYIPGHVKVDYKHAIGELQPDYIVNVWIKFNPKVDVEFDSLLTAGGYVKRPEGGWIKADLQRREK